jgi:hypothetical protein
MLRVFAGAFLGLAFDRTDLCGAACQGAVGSPLIRKTAGVRSRGANYSYGEHATLQHD